MTKEDVITLAREAGIPFNKYDLIGCDSCERDIDAELERFAALVANDVLEAAARIAGRMFIRDTENYPGAIAEEIRAMKESI